MDFNNWSISDYAAWWGAIIATLALLWNIVVAIQSGPRVYVRASPNMKVFPEDPITKDKTYISVIAVNRGNAPTTITHFCGFYADSLWNLIRRKRQHFIINAHPSLGKPVPYVLAPGKEWSNLADQDDIQDKMGKGYLYIGIIHNQKKRPIYTRVKLRA